MNDKKVLIIDTLSIKMMEGMKAQDELLNSIIKEIKNLSNEYDILEIYGKNNNEGEG